MTTGYVTTVVVVDGVRPARGALVRVLIERILCESNNSSWFFVLHILLTNIQNYLWIANIFANFCINIQPYLTAKSAKNYPRITRINISGILKVISRLRSTKARNLTFMFNLRFLTPSALGMTQRIPNILIRGNLRQWADKCEIRGQIFAALAVTSLDVKCKYHQKPKKTPG